MIKVDEDYYISADTYCYAVMKKRWKGQKWKRYF